MRNPAQFLDTNPEPWVFGVTNDWNNALLEANFDDENKHNSNTFWGSVMKRVLLTIALSVGLPLGAFAAPVAVDLSGWQAENGPGGAGSNWVLQPGNNSVLQRNNSRPTVFYDPGSNAQGTALSGTIKRDRTGGDDDFIGFVLGFNTGEFGSAAADFWLIDWKQTTQTFGGRTAEIGLSLSHVTGDVSTAGELDFWDHEGVVNEVQRATNLGNVGYNNDQEYTFKLTFTDSLIEVFVDDVKELSFSGSFTDGAFGFYNYSQDTVLYAGIGEEDLPPDVTPVPLPAGLPLLLAAAGFLGLLRRRLRQRPKAC